MWSRQCYQRDVEHYRSLNCSGGKEIDTEEAKLFLASALWVVPYDQSYSIQSLVSVKQPLIGLVSRFLPLLMTLQ